MKPLFRPGSGSRREKLKTNRKNAKNLEIIVLILKNLKKISISSMFLLSNLFLLQNTGTGTFFNEKCYRVFKLDPDPH